MRFLITAGPGHDSKVVPEDAFNEDLFAAYMRFNEEMHAAGILVTSEGLAPEGARVQIEVRKGRRTVVDGPFTEAKELLGGFYLIDVASKEEAIAWALRCPSGLGFDDVLQIYQMTSLEDVPAHLAELTKKVAPTWFASVTKPR